jgi:hypothetical protein
VPRKNLVKPNMTIRITIGNIIIASSHQIFQKIYNSNTKYQEILTLVKNLMGTNNISNLSAGRKQNK